MDYKLIEKTNTTGVFDKGARRIPSPFGGKNMMVIETRDKQSIAISGGQKFKISAVLAEIIVDGFNFSHLVS
jgi:hypothetical protein